MKQLSNHRKPAARTLAALAITTLLALAPTGCVNNDLDPAADTHNPEAMLDPETPVAITATLGAYGAASPTRAQLPTARQTLDLAAIPAEGEITAATRLGTGSGKVAAIFSLYGAINSGYSTTNGGTVGSFILADGFGNAIDGGLRMSHFNTAPAAADGTKQRHSRLGRVGFVGSNDRLVGFANRAYDADTKSIAYHFALRHTTAKVSLLVVNDGGVAIDLATALDGSGGANAPKLTAYHSSVFYFETESADNARRALDEYMTTPLTDGNYPVTTTAAAALGSCPESITKEFAPTHPTGEAVPTNLMNVIIHTNPTMKESGSYPNPIYFPAITPGEAVTVGGTSVTAIATGLTGANNPAAVLPFDATAGKTNRHRITLSLKANDENGTSAGTYGINLDDIVLTGLPAGDGREGRLRYLLPGEHMVVTLKIDRNKILSATAILAPWTEATANGDLGDTAIPGGGGEMPTTNHIH